MGRSFGSDFTTRMLEAHQRPYLVLKVSWNGGTKYYIDREPDTFDSSGLRHPADIESGLVVDWGVPSQTLREMQIGSVDSLTIKVEDRSGALSTIMDAGPQQRRTVEIYRMFDETDVIWPDDAGLIFVGTTKPFTYTESDNVVTFEVEDPARQLVGVIEKPAKRVIFPDVPIDYEDKHIPIGWGYVERVEAVLVAKPWQTRISEAMNLGLGSGSRVPIDDHPDDLGVEPDVSIDCLIGPADSDVGVMALVGMFRQSVNKATQPSYFEVTGFAGCESAAYSIASVRDSGTDYAAAMVFKSGVAADDARLASGARCSVGTGAATYFGNVIGVWTNDTRVLVTFDNPDLCAALTPGSVLKIWYRTLEIEIDTEDADTTPRSAGDLDDLDAGTDQIQRVFYFQQPAGIVGDLSEMFRPPFNATPLGSGDPFPVSGLEANTPTAGTYRLTVEYDQGTYPGLNAYGAGDTLDCGEQANLPVEFPAGYVLRPDVGEYVYAFNAFPSKELIRVEGYGDSPDVSETGRKDFINIPATYKIRLTGDDADLGEAYARLNAWTADLSDGTWNLTGGLDGTEADFGTDISTITFVRSPRRVNPALDSERIWVTYRGIDYNFNGSSTVIYNPADVLLAYLTNTSLLGVVGGSVDTASFTACASSRELVNRAVGFAQTESKDGLTLLQDIARQCRSNIIFDQGQFHMQVLQNESRYWAATFRATSILENSLTTRETPIDEMATRLTAKWRYKWDDKHKPRQRLAVNLGAEAEYPKNNKTFEIWLYHEPEFVDEELAFWLERWSRIYKVITFSTFGRALVLQPGDWIDLGYTDGNGRVIIAAGTRCEVIGVKDKAPSGLFEVTCRYPYFSF